MSSSKNPKQTEQPVSDRATSLDVKKGGEDKGKKPVKAGPGPLTIVKTQPDGGEVTLSLWTDIIRGLGAEGLCSALEQAKVIHDLTDFIRGIEYQGFNRDIYIKHALTKMSVKYFIEFAIIGAIRGSNFGKIKDKCLSMPAYLVEAHTDLPMKKKPNKSTDLTILRNTASIPQWCAYWMARASVEKKLPASDCPAALQFPGAASLPMSKTVRIHHINFCQAFSALLPGGQFNFNIYLTAYSTPIPLGQIPAELLPTLGVGSSSDSYRLTEEEQKQYGSAMVLKAK
jgi:hypothetical protein